MWQKLRKVTLVDTSKRFCNRCYNYILEDHITERDDSVVDLWRDKLNKRKMLTQRLKKPSEQAAFQEEQLQLRRAWIQRNIYRRNESGIIVDAKVTMAAE